MERVHTVPQVRRAVARLRADGGAVALVPTMGALHAGHLSLVREARGHADHVVVSIFVNPTQFAPDEDLAAYPRDLDGDAALLRGLGRDAPDLLFVPAVEDVYPRGTPRTRVLVDGLTDRLCGASRPGHFDGVGLVVTKLHNLVRPDVAVYGRKDHQQLQVIRTIVADLDQPVEVVGAPIVREPDGLALSSRNAYLSDEERRAALTLSRALRAAVVAARAARAEDGVAAPATLHAAAHATLRGATNVRLDYLEVVDPTTLAPLDAQRGEDAAGRDGERPPSQLLVAVAAHVGPARLIDNVVVGDVEDEERLLAATA